MTHLPTQKENQTYENLFINTRHSRRPLAGLCACSSDDDAAETGSACNPSHSRRSSSATRRPPGIHLRWEAVDDGGPTSTRSTAERDLDDRLPAGIQQSGTAERVCRGGQVPPLTRPNTPNPLHLHPRADRRPASSFPSRRSRSAAPMRRKTVISLDRSARSGTLRVYGRRGRCRPPETVRSSCRNRQGPHLLSVRAMTSDATRFTNSEAAQLSFVTSDADVPPLVIAPTTIISDAVALTSTPPATKHLL